MKGTKLKDGQHWIRVGEPNETSFTLANGKVTICSDPAYMGKSVEDMQAVIAADPPPHTHFFKPFAKIKTGGNSDGPD